MRRVGLIGGVVLAGLLGVATAQAQPPFPTQDITAASTDCSTAGSCAVFQPGTLGVFSVSVQGTYSGTLQFEGLLPGGTWFSIQMSNVSSGAASTSTTSTGQFAVSNIGFSQVRVRCSAYSSGTASISASAGQVPGTYPYLFSSGISINQGTLTASQPAISTTATWNNSGVTFTGWKENITDTASAAASKLLDLQVGGSSKFSVQKDGSVLHADGSASEPSISFASEPTTGWYRAGTADARLSITGTDGFRVTTTAVALPATYNLGWGSTGVGGLDVLLYRDAANTLALRNGTNAQAFRLYNTYTDASNYERLHIGWASNVASITPTAAGTGTLRPLVIGQVTTVSGLPTCNSAAKGARAFVTDATATTFLTAVVGSGSNNVPVVCDGTSWKIG